MDGYGSGALYWRAGCTSTACDEVPPCGEANLVHIELIEVQSAGGGGEGGKKLAAMYDVIRYVFFFVSGRCFYSVHVIGDIPALL